MKKKTSNILALRCALLIAVSQAEIFKDIEDGGTCNFDTPCLILQGWNEIDIREAFLLTGLRPYIRQDNTVMIFDACSGQGFRRTAMAEAIRDSLKQSGYNAYVDYRMD